MTLCWPFFSFINFCYFYKLYFLLLWEGTLSLIKIYLAYLIIQILKILIYKSVLIFSYKNLKLTFLFNHTTPHTLTFILTTFLCSYTFFWISFSTSLFTTFKNTLFYKDNFSIIWLNSFLVFFWFVLRSIVSIFGFYMHIFLTFSVLLMVLLLTLYSLEICLFVFYLHLKMYSSSKVALFFFKTIACNIVFNPIKSFYQLFHFLWPFLRSYIH